ncbi:MAG: hypothetical protein ACI4O3_06645 [Oscillospiraceae bacterium]
MKQKKKTLTPEERIRLLIPQGMEVLRGFVEQHVPEQGRFQPVFVTFDYPGTDYEGVLRVEYDETEAAGTGRRLTATMHPAGSDKAVFHTIWRGDRRQLIGWLSEQDNAGELRESYGQLKAAVDRFD